MSCVASGLSITSRRTDCLAGSPGVGSPDGLAARRNRGPRSSRWRSESAVPAETCCRLCAFEGQGQSHLAFGFNGSLTARRGRGRARNSICSGLDDRLSLRASIAGCEVHYRRRGVVGCSYGRRSGFGLRAGGLLLGRDGHPAGAVGRFTDAGRTRPPRPKALPRALGGPGRQRGGSRPVGLNVADANGFSRENRGRCSPSSSCNGQPGRPAERVIFRERARKDF